MMIKRSLKITLKFGNTGKREQLDELWQAYKTALEDFLDRLLAGETLSEEFLKSYDSPLSYRYKQCAKRQAMKIFKCWCRGKTHKNKPALRNPSMTLDSRFVKVQRSENSFDFWIQIATLEKGNPVLIPAKSYGYLNGYLRDWELVLGGRLVKRKGTWHVILTFQKEVPQRDAGEVKSADIGYRKMVTTNEGEVHGAGLKRLIEKADRKRQGSKAYERSKAEIKNYINRELKKLIISTLMILVIENLKHLKRGKQGVWSRSVNRKFNLWIYGYIVQRIIQLCEVAGVQYHRVDPSYTSQRCPVPTCGHVEESNRRGEVFQCRKCGYADDADHVGALNILWRFGQESIVPDVPESCLE